MCRSADVWKAAPIVHNVNQFRSWVATADAQAEKYQTSPSAVDFKSAKASVRDKELVDMIEKFYVAAEIPPEVHVWDQADHDYKLAHFEQVKEQAKVYSELKEDLIKEIAFQKATKTTADTTVYDLMCNNPTIHEEIEDEIERREWFKDIGLGAK
jgi:Asp-tRNA(Asn)/Glu-tRNA(Gln) amidotransferase B subunit